DLRGRATHPPPDAGAACVRLGAAAHPASAERTFRVKDHVADLARAAVRSTVEAAAKNQAGADARAPGDIGQVICAPARPPLVLGDGRDVGVVLEVDARA